MLARGDRRVSKAILNAYKNGALFDSWHEFFSPSVWDEAFSSAGVQKQTYKAEISVNETLAWDFINVGITKKFLQKEYEKSKRNEVTGGCQTGCKNCGLQGRCTLV